MRQVLQGREVFDRVVTQRDDLQTRKSAKGAEIGDPVARRPNSDQLGQAGQRCQITKAIVDQVDSTEGSPTGHHAYFFDVVVLRTEPDQIVELRQ